MTTPIAISMEQTTHTQILDPETEFLLSNKQTGNEWELFKENVRPLKRGRNVNLLNESLKSQTDNHLKKSLLENRRRLIEAIDEYQGDDPLHPWLECIKWVQESFPAGGDYSGLVVIYEQCVRAFWHTERYKDDLRYLKVWLEYAENCADAEIIFSFLDANGIGHKHSSYYITYALLMESKNKLKNCNDIFNLGIAREAQPLTKLQAAYRKFLSRSMTRPVSCTEEPTDHHFPARSFGTVLARGESGNQIADNSDICRKKVKLDRAHSASLCIYKDANGSINPSHQPDVSKTEQTPWRTLGTQAERNKENAPVPTKWASNKIYQIPQRPGSRFVRAAASTCIEVFVDEECSETTAMASEGGKTSMLQLRKGENKDIKKETELLKENPLRHFPQNSLPR